MVACRLTNSVVSIPVIVQPVGFGVVAAGAMPRRQACDNGEK